MKSKSGKYELKAPRVFISYSWDSEDHKSWVLQLATRLINNGIDVILDRWDAKLGSDLPLFMEQGLGEADRIIAISTEEYVKKANDAKGGVGYERRIITADLMRDLNSGRVIPVVKNNTAGRLPRFMGSAIYLDFRDEEKYEDRYAELIHDLHGKDLLPRPPIGPSPFIAIPVAEVPIELEKAPARYVSPSNSGKVRFDYSNNSGQYTIGLGDMSFTLNTSEAGHGCIYFYNDHASVKSVALAKNISSPNEIKFGSSFDSSSRTRSVQVGDAVIVRNRNDYWAVICVDEVQTRESSKDGNELLVFRYVIQPDHSDNFTK